MLSWDHHVVARQKTSTGSPAPSAAGEGAGSRVARNVAIVAGAELAGKAATLVFTIVAARSLGAAGFGAFSYALAFSMLLATLPSWGFDSVLIRRGSADPDDLGPALAQTLALRSILAVPVLLLGGGLGALSRPSTEASVALMLILLATVLDTYGDAGRSAAGALEKRGRTSVALIAQRLATAVLAIVLLGSGSGLVTVAIVYLVASVFGQLLTWRALRVLRIRPDWSAVTRPQLRLMWRSSFVLGIDTLVAMALFRLDAVLLGLIRGDEELASYAVAYRLLETVLFVTWAVSRAIFPAMSRAKNDSEAVLLAEQGLSAVAAVFVPYGALLILEGPRLLQLLFGAEYTDQSALILRLLAAAPLAFALSYLASEVLIARNRNRAVLVSTVGAAVLNIVLNAVVIPLYGGPGAALATTVSYAAEGMVAIVLVAPTMGYLRVDRALRLPVLALPPMIAAMLVMHLPVLVECALGGLVYVLAWVPLARWLFPEQLRLVRSLAKRP